jgi:hypothetical protein
MLRGRKSTRRALAWDGWWGCPSRRKSPIRRAPAVRRGLSQGRETPATVPDRACPRARVRAASAEPKPRTKTTESGSNARVAACAVLDVNVQDRRSRRASARSTISTPASATASSRWRASVSQPGGRDRRRCAGKPSGSGKPRRPGIVPTHIGELQGDRALLRRHRLGRQPIIGPPVHPARFLRKWFEEICAPTKAHP